MSKQFKKLEDVFNISSDEEEIESSDTEQNETVNEEETIQQALTNAKNLEKELIDIKGFEDHDEEMDELAKMAVTAHKDLLDLGMNVEIRHAGEIFSTSSTMLKIAVDAKNNKVEKKLKLLKLQLDKLKLDRATSNENPIDAPIDGNAVKLDFNELLKEFKKAN
jgi:hypothetical protein